MSAKYYPFRLGSIQCNVLLDGASPLSVERILKRFSAGTEAEYRQAYAEIGLSLDEAENSLNGFVAQVGDETVLVDAGEAGKPNGGLLLQSMKLAGIKPESVTLVVITHSHGDHVQGLMTNENEPAFPNATYVISKPEMAFWQKRIDNGTANHQPIVAMIQAKGLRLIDMDEPIIPGVTAVPIPGHTPGQIAVLFESENRKLIHMADLLHTPMQFAHPEWSALFDADTSVSVPTRRAALARAADDDVLALFYHLTFPGLGRIRRTKNGFVWEPAASSS